METIEGHGVQAEAGAELGPSAKIAATDGGFGSWVPSLSLLLKALAPSTAAIGRAWERRAVGGVHRLPIAIAWGVRTIARVARHRAAAEQRDRESDHHQHRAG